MSMFSKVYGGKVKKNKFDLSHEFKFSCDMGKLIPVCAIPTIPGDKFNISQVTLVKLLAQTQPVMHNVDIFFRFFYVPNRLVWKNFDEFITGGKDGNSSAVAPYVTLNNVQKSSLADYLVHAPTDVAKDLEVDAMPFRAYNLICNHYFRDQFSQEDLSINVEDGEDTTAYSVQNVLWEKDYFTSARHQPQAGTGAILPIGSSAPVYGNGKGLGLTDGTKDFSPVTSTSYSANDRNYMPDAYNKDVGTSTSDFTDDYTTTNSVVGLVGKGKESGAYADLSQASASTVEQVRNAFKVQEYLEKLIRVGYKMKDWLYGFFGVKSSDARLQYPEYIGGMKQSLFFSEVLQTSETSITPLGTQGGVSTTLASGKVLKKFCEEFGYIIGIMYIRPRTQYYQGISRLYTKKTKYDYFNPIFQTLGEQAIKNKELKFTTDDDYNEATFGYCEHYMEYKQMESVLGGYFKDANSFLARTLARDFENNPQLNEDFLNCNPSKRIYATEGYDNHVLVDCGLIIQALRPIKKFVVPASL